MEADRDTPTVETPADLTLAETDLQVLDTFARWANRLGIFLIVLGILYVLTVFVYAIPTVIAGIFFIAMGTRLTAAAREIQLAREEADGEALIAGLAYIKTFFIQNLVFYSLVILFMILVAVLMVAFAPMLEHMLEGTEGFTSFLR
ncbi:MAG: hypothetical protein D6762_04995 [Candidatus Neomarinimicrobiota bacterium]|nr:MAG: hypothetical protein D6762_04995 [Candidatus Neomarinimicrobiota bacterium]